MRKYLCEFQFDIQIGRFRVTEDKTRGHQDNVSGSLIDTARPYLATLQHMDTYRNKGNWDTQLITNYGNAQLYDILIQIAN